jgi:hypothetical protein
MRPEENDYLANGCDLQQAEGIIKVKEERSKKHVIT